MIAVDFPSIQNLVEWKNIFGDGTFFAFNKIGLISVLALLIPVALFLFAKKDAVPRGLQNVTEGAVEFVENQVIMPTIGPDGMRFLPLLLSIFLFIFFGNIFEVIPTFNMPANARMANPLLLAILVWAVFIFVGVKNHGAKYFIEIIWPPSVPVGLRPLVGLIETLSVFILRPFGLAVRLFANMLAGHILLVTFGWLCVVLFVPNALAAILPFSFAMLVLLTGFEIFVSFLQAFVFALLTAVYIDSSLHPAH